MGDATADPYFDLGAYGRRAATRSEEAQAWFDRGLVWSYAFNHEEAVRCFERAIEHDPAFALVAGGRRRALRRIVPALVRFRVPLVMMQAIASPAAARRRVDALGARAAGITGSSPDASAASIIRLAIRSFTEPPGLRYSTLASTIGASTPSRVRCRRTKGVLPMRSTIESTYCIRPI